MINRIIDKSILIIVGDLLYSVICKKGVDQMMVIAFLFAVIILVAGEILRETVSNIIIMLISLVVCYFFPDFMPVYFICIYNILASEDIKKVISLIGSRDNKNNSDIDNKTVLLRCTGVGLAVIYAFFECHLLYITSGFEGMFLCIGFSLISIAMVIRCVRYEALKERYYKQYDEMRYETMVAKEQRQEAYRQNEENVYMATLKERNRIAREIHDNVGHMLTRTIVQMQAVKVINQDENIKPYLDSIDDTVNQAMLNIRKSVHELHDDSLDMSVMIGEIVKAVPDHIKVALKTSIDSAVSTDIRNTIVGIIREAVTNMAKYSKGDSARVEVIEHATFWRVLVSDNGKNEKKDYTRLLRDKGAESGLGLINIYQRVLKYNGNINITSDEKGFMILATLPKIIEK